MPQQNKQNEVDEAGNADDYDEDATTREGTPEEVSTRPLICSQSK